MELATGRRGSPHITSQQDRQKHQGIFGGGAYILNTGSMLEPEVQSSNKIHIKDGALMLQGALFTVKVGTYDEVTINNGNQGMKRKDLIVARYTYDSSDNIEAGEWAVIQGTPAADNPVVPEVTSGDIQAGDSVVECPVFVVNLDGINVTGIDIIPDTLRDMYTLNADLAKLQIVGKYSKAFTNKTVQYPNEGRICFKQSDTPPEDIDDTIASFGNDGIITIKRDMTALINVHVSGKWAGLNERCWIYLRDRTNGKSLSQSIQNGYYTTCTISTVQNLTSGQQLEVTTQEAFAINDGLRNNYIEIIPLRG